MANDLILLEGEQAFVVNEDGAGVNFKIGDGTKTFAELPFWISYDQSSFVPISGNVLPASDGNVHYSIVPAGTYTQSVGADVVVADGNFGIISNDGTSWSLVDMGELPQAEIDKTNTIKEKTEKVTTEEAVIDYALPTVSPRVLPNGSEFIEIDRPDLHDSESLSILDKDSNLIAELK